MENIEQKEEIKVADTAKLIEDKKIENEHIGKKVWTIVILTILTVLSIIGLTVIFVLLP